MFVSSIGPCLCLWYIYRDICVCGISTVMFVTVVYLPWCLCLRYIYPDLCDCGISTVMVVAVVYLPWSLCLWYIYRDLCVCGISTVMLDFVWPHPVGDNLLGHVYIVYGNLIATYKFTVKHYCAHSTTPFI